MGQKNATLYVAIDQPEVIPGQNITGKIYLDVLKPEKISVATSLILTFQGQEESIASWDDKANTYDPNRRHSSMSQKREILNSSFTLATSHDGNILPGRQEYPFQVTVPLGTPPTFSTIIPREHRGGECSIVYTIEAKLHQVGWFKQENKTVAPLTVKVHPSPNVTQAPVYSLPTRYDMNYLPIFSLCCNKGFLTLGLSVSTGVLCHNSYFEISYVVQQHSTTEIEGMEVSIMEDVTWKAKSEHRTVSTKLFEVILMPQRADPLLTHADLRELLDAGKYKISGHLPSTARGTMKTTLIEVKHTIFMKLRTSFGSKKPVISAPIYVHPYLASPQQDFHDTNYVVSAQPAPYVVNAFVVDPSHQYIEMAQVANAVASIEPSAPRLEDMKPMI